MRRVGVVLLALAALAPAAGAGTIHKYAGHAILPPPLPAKSALADLNDTSNTLVELDRIGAPMAAAVLRANGARQIAPELDLWRVSSLRAQRILPSLMRLGLVRSVTPDTKLHAFAATNQYTDPLVPYEWWIPAIGADKFDPPGPGVPLTIIDSGLDVSHPDFNGRPNTTTLNAQDFGGNEEWHGTAVASVAAAPTNGVGLVGVYPQAVLRFWDAAPGNDLTVGHEIQGIISAINHGRGVINLSLGSEQRIFVEQEAMMAAFGTGSLIVVATGNEREKGSPIEYPASYPHILTVGATDENDAVTVFSNRSPFMDLSAPGQDIPAAIPTSVFPAGYSSVDGTSFATPLTAGASASVWTARPSLNNTQMFDLMRLTARDAGPQGWDPDYGFGILNIPAAASAAAPRKDPQEPNEDIYLVKPNGLFRAGHPAFRGKANLIGRLDVTEDPEDVYRAFVPHKGRLIVRLKPNANVNLAVWGPKTKTVFERGKALKRDLRAVSSKKGTKAELIALKNSGPSTFVYIDAYLGRGVGGAQYAISIRR
jgi:subtilisin family serine protease